jgi:iron complex transport system substrate-binding protein
MDKRNIIIFSVLGAIIIGSIVGLSLINYSNPGNGTITDMAGRKINVPDTIERVIGIEAGALRLLVYLQAADLVVGVEEIEHTSNNTRPYNIAHPEFQNLPSIGPIHGGDAELIVAQEPDIIFWTYAEAGEADELQSKTGIPVVVIHYGDLENQKDTFYEALTLIGEILERETRAENVISFFNATLSDLNNRTKDIPGENKPTVYVGGVSYRGAHGLTSTEVQYGPFDFINAKNVASELGDDYDHVFLDPEQVITWNPDVIFIDEGGLELTLQDLNNDTAFYNTLSAVQNEELYCVLPYNYYTTNFGSILANSYYIGSIIFSEHFNDINIESKAGDVYSFLVGEDVYSIMKSVFGGFKPLEF